MKIDFNKNNGLVPAIIQDAETKTVLMLGYMNRDAYSKTIETKRVTFYSRSKQRIWTKGETSGNYLNLISIDIDCDNDTLLVMVNPSGPVCHKGTDTCWDEENKSDQVLFLKELENVIQDRKENPTEQSYTATLFEKGVKKISQKLGEEAVELIIESNYNKKNLFQEEAADLFYHYLVLLAAKDSTLNDVIKVLKNRRR